MIQVQCIDYMGSDLSVVNAARVSFGKKKEKIDEQDIRLIRYLGSHKHISPFGHCFSTFHVHAPVFVARQLVKHKFLRWNEVSRRYVNSDPEFYSPQEWRSKSEDKKQGSGEPLEFNVHRHNMMVQLGIESVSKYKYLLKEGVCEEQARMVLPQNMMTEWYWSGSMDAFADMCNLRCKPDTQYESQLVAREVNYHMQRLFPHSWSALRKD